jgi:tRNA(fMet)-specific endonuclease VapC
MSGERVMNRALVDTDILSELLRGKSPTVHRRAEAYLAEHERLTISVVTVFEVVRGRHQAAQPERAAEFVAWARTANVIAFDDECARVAGEIAGAVMRSGQSVGVADVLIAATAIAHHLTLVTGNVAHFDRMKQFGLTVDNWREPVPPA